MINRNTCTNRTAGTCRRTHAITIKSESRIHGTRRCDCSGSVGGTDQCTTTTRGTGNTVSRIRCNTEAGGRTVVNTRATRTDATTGSGAGINGIAVDGKSRINGTGSSDCARGIGGTDQCTTTTRGTGNTVSRIRCNTEAGGRTVVNTRAARTDATTGSGAGINGIVVDGIAVDGKSRINGTGSGYRSCSVSITCKRTTTAIYASNAEISIRRYR